MTKRSVIATLAAGAAGVFTLVPAGPAGAATGSFGCSAGAVTGSVLGQRLDPLAVAGDSGACRSADATSALPALLGSAPVIARTEFVGKRSDALTQKVTSTAGVGAIRVGGLDTLQSLLPIPALPAGLDALPVALPVVPIPTIPTIPSLPGLPALGGITTPITGTATGSLLPSLIRIDALDAVKALLPSAAQLPDLLQLAAARSTATGSCVNGAPVLDGTSQLAGLRVLGHDLGTDRVLDQALGILGGSTIPLSGVDLQKIGLPAGLSLADPLVGPILQTAIRTALAALPPIEIPALVGNVKLTPASQERSGDELTQRSGRLQVSVLGQDLVDLALGAASVSKAGVDCAPAEETVAPASQLAIECAGRPVTLVDVAEKKEYVSLLGAVSSENVGRKVSIVRTDIDKVVATGTVRPDGFFRTKAPLPPRAVRSSNDTRYQAVLDGHKSLALKLQRRMRISRMRNLGEQVQIIGKISGPLVPGQQIVIRQRESCTKDVIVKRFTPKQAGAWRVTLPAPTEGQAAVYRATTQVFGADETERKFPTFTLPGYVSL
jgi:hypothetical protein